MGTQPIQKGTEQSAPPSATTERDTQSLGGKYLTFFLGEEEYGLEILKVHELIGMIPVTPVPRTPSFIRGVINLRGRVIPVVDLRSKFGFEAREDTEETCIIVVQCLGVQMGIVVDQVSEVLDIGSQDIEDTPSFGMEINTEFILGVGKSEGGVKLLLDIDKVLSSNELADIRGVAASQPEAPAAEQTTESTESSPTEDSNKE